ncbi:50S ribosomal protein L18 [Patescibacteria group bacterium]|nr:50S ribosomal protein L18 [Patescibacteria group bacterium]
MKNLARALQAKAVRQTRRKHRVNTSIKSTASLPRLIISKSNLYIYAQIVDLSGKVVAAADDRDLKKGTKTERAMEVGKAIAKKSIEKGVTNVVFDRNGYRFHGRVKGVSVGANEAGLKN